MAKIPTKLEISAGGVAFRKRNGRVEVALISVGEAHRWQLPKGVVDKNESTEAAALREVREEAGVETKLIERIDKVEYWYFAKHAPEPVRIHKFVYFYLLEYKSGDVRDHDSEVNEARWVEIDGALKVLAFDSEKKIVEKAKAMIEAGPRPSLESYRMKIIDTHQHLWDLDLLRYSWCEGIPELNRSFRMDDYLEATRGLDVHKTVFVEADVDEAFMLDEARSILKLAEEHNLLEGVVASGRPEHQGFRNYVDQIAGHPKLKGIRRVLHVQPDELSESPMFVENVRLLQQYGLSFDLCVLARQLPQAINLVKQCPGVSFILDHCGNPLVKEREMEPWRTHVKEIASLPNVVCKVSGIVVNADQGNWTVEDLRPYVNYVIECFGWDRVMFGSDWPVCTLAASYKQWVETLTSLTEDAGESNQRKLFCENAERIYRL